METHYYEAYIILPKSLLLDQQAIKLGAERGFRHSIEIGDKDGLDSVLITKEMNLEKLKNRVFDLLATLNVDDVKIKQVITDEDIKNLLKTNLRTQHD